MAANSTVGSYGSVPNLQCTLLRGNPAETDVCDPRTRVARIQLPHSLHHSFIIIYPSRYVKLFSSTTFQRELVYYSNLFYFSITFSLFELKILDQPKLYHAKHFSARFARGINHCSAPAAPFCLYTLSRSRIPANQLTTGGGGAPK